MKALELGTGKKLAESGVELSWRQLVVGSQLASCIVTWQLRPTSRLSTSLTRSQEACSSTPRSRDGEYYRLLSRGQLFAGQICVLSDEETTLLIT